MTVNSDATDGDACRVRAILLSVANADGEEFAVPSTRTNAAREQAKKILLSSAITKFDSALQKELTQLIVKSTQTCKSFSKMKEMLWRDFHVVRQTRLKEMWKKFITSIGHIEDCDSDPLLMQYVLEQMFEKVITSTFTVMTNESPEEPITANEENALRYAAGYVPRALITKLSRPQSRHHQPSEQQAILSCLRAMRASDDEDGFDSLISYTRRWTKAINCGGLFASRMKYTSCSLRWRRR